MWTYRLLLTHHALGDWFIWGCWIPVHGGLSIPEEQRFCSATPTTARFFYGNPQHTQCGTTFPGEKSWITRDMIARDCQQTPNSLKLWTDKYSMTPIGPTLLKFTCNSLDIWLSFGADYCSSLSCLCILTVELVIVAPHKWVQTEKALLATTYLTLVIFFCLLILFLGCLRCLSLG